MNDSDGEEDDDADGGKYWDSSEVYIHLDGDWRKKATVGDVPSATSGATAQVLGDTMYVIGGFKV